MKITLFKNHLDGIQVTTELDNCLPLRNRFWGNMVKTVIVVMT